MEKERDISEDKGRTMLADSSGIEIHGIASSVEGAIAAVEGNDTPVENPENEHNNHVEDPSHEEEHFSFDFTDNTKAQLVSFLKELNKENNFKKIDLALKEIKPVYDEMYESEKKAALDRFLADGGSASDFEFRPDDTDIAFDANYKLLKDKRNQFYRDQEEKKTENLKRKEEVLEKLRAFVDAEETNISFDTFKKLQEEWKSIGNVPAAQARTLWANYKALVDRFYDNRSIYFELKELDRKKNLEQKLELCERAERLKDVELIKDAVKELNELHIEFKHIGPVPAEDQEAVWQRFKAASDLVYARRDAYVENLQKDLQANLEKKLKICEEIQPFASFNSDRIKDWNQKTKEVLLIQKNWEAIGGLPRNKAKEVNKKFWSAFKHFFTNKSSFFKKLDESRNVNLKLKQELVLKAQQLKEGTDWDKTANEFKRLQKEWKEIGPVPEKMREKIYAEFKEACDFFFNHLRANKDQKDGDFKANLGKKEAILNELHGLASTKTGTPERFMELVAAFNDIGFVPKNAITSIRQKFSAAVDSYINSLDISEEDKAKLLLESQIMGFKNDPMGEKKIFHKEQLIRKKIIKVENDIAVWKNNMEFFAHSKNAEKFKDEFNSKINSAKSHLDELKQQLKLIRTVS